MTFYYIWFNMADDERSVALEEPDNCSEMAMNSPLYEAENEFEVEKIIAMVKSKVIHGHNLQGGI